MKISALGVEEQRVNVIIDFEDPRQAWESLGSEYRIEARVIMWDAEDVVQVPTSCLFRNGDGWAVFVVNGGLAELREVTVGHRNGVAAEMVEGLRAGETVIVYPSSDVKAGVEIVERDTD
jgi:HlyD family secretion protein